MATLEENTLASPAQLGYLSKLILSAAVPPEDATAVGKYLESGRATSAKVSAGIDWAKGLIEQRDKAKVASATRKAAYQAKPAKLATPQRQPQPADILFH